MKTRTCKKCKARVLDRNRICHHCGAALGQGVAPFAVLFGLTSLLIGCLVASCL